MQQALDAVFADMPSSRDPRTGAFDGTWGPETVQTVRAYQDARSIPPGGREAGRRTFAALNEDLKRGGRRRPSPHGGGPAYEPGEIKESFGSPGLVEEVPEGFLLSGFGVGKHFIKPEHQQFLRKLVADRNLTDPGSETSVVSLVGFTDAVDREARNQPLREDRAAAVAEFLTANLGVPEDNVGVDLAAPAGNFQSDNTTRSGRAHNRAVLIRMGSLVIPPIPVPPKPTPSGKCQRNQRSSQWALQSNLSFSPPARPGVVITTLNFILIDRSAHGCKRVLQFTGFGGGFGVSLPASVALPSPTDFTTTTPLVAEDFEGGGAIRQVNLGLGAGFSEAVATLHPRSAPDVDISGFQLSAGADVSIVGGFWKLLD